MGQTLKRGSIIVHLTDGRHNRGLEPQDANKILQDRYGVRTIHLLWERRTTHYKQLPHKVITLAEFPEALFEILKMELHLGKIV